MSLSSGLIRLAGLRTVGHVSRHLTIRYYSSTAHDPWTLSAALLKKVASRDRDSLAAIHALYPALVAELKNSRISSPHPIPLSQHHFINVLEVLGASGRPADLQRVEEILGDMPTTFGIKPSVEVHTAIIRALIKHGNIHTIHRWLSNMPSRPGHFSPTLEQYHIVLESCIYLASFKFMRNLVRSMRPSGCKPTNETYGILIRARWQLAQEEDKIPHLVVFSSLLDDMKRAGLPYDQDIDTLLYDGYAERDYPTYANQIQARYRSQFPDVETPQQRREIELNAKLSQKAQTTGVEGAIALFKSTMDDGHTTSAATLRAILRHSRNIEDLRTVEASLEAETTVDHWSLLISNNVRAGHLPNALLIYQEAKSAGVTPDAPLVGPLIKQLCRTTLKSPSDENLDHALSIYEDLVQVSPPTADLPNSDTKHSVGPDADIYQNLLRGLASSPNIDKYFPIAKSLMEDMETRNVPTNNSFTASSNIILLMKRASSIEEALEIYHRLRSGLDEKGYAIVLNAFCKLSFGEGIQIPSMSRYFDIVKDMRRAGLEITVEVYTILLHQLGVIATRMTDRTAEYSPDLREQLINATRRTHDLLTLDAAVSPDAHVWNQLMDTYQRLGCFGDSYRVWDMMYLSGRFDHVSVSIILDACGYAGAWQVAKKICTNLFNDRFSFNLHNWNTWLECLCRLGKLNDAVKVACLEMGKEQNPVLPDVESVRILVKFARQAGHETEVLSRIHRYLPDLWKTLPDDLRRL